MGPRFTVGSLGFPLKYRPHGSAAATAAWCLSRPPWPLLLLLLAGSMPGSLAAWRLAFLAGCDCPAGGRRRKCCMKMRVVHCRVAALHYVLAEGTHALAHMKTLDPSHCPWPPPPPGQGAGAQPGGAGQRPCGGGLCAAPAAHLPQGARCVNDRVKEGVKPIRSLPLHCASVVRLRCLVLYWLSCVLACLRSSACPAQGMPKGQSRGVQPARSVCTWVAASPCPCPGPFSLKAWLLVGPDRCCAVA